MNLGDDADTVGAIYGQLAGAYYGVEAIPEDWKEKCSLASLIELFADELLSLADFISVLPAAAESAESALYPSPVDPKCCELGQI